VNTLKSAALIIVLLVVLFGVYVALNKPEFPPGAGHGDSDIGPLLIEPGPADPAAARALHPAPALMPGRGEASPADAGSAGSGRGGTYQPNIGASSLPPPPQGNASDPPADPAASHSGGVRRGSYETPATGDRAENSVANASASGSSASLTTWSLNRDWQEAQQLVADGKFRAALAKLSPYYSNTDLTTEQRTHLVGWLDALAAKVIYSREHLLAAPYQVRKNETLFDIAEQFKVPWRLLKSINGDSVTDPMVLVPATELKIVPGPFRADVNLAGNELTLFLGELYAGRFPLTVGDQPPAAGEYKVLDKRCPDKTYYSLDGHMIPANDPSNPYGGVWIGLGGEISIHGSPATPAAQTLGCISLSPQDAHDVYGILSINSEVKIRR
jgi:L,D-transpeptidase catalytic domain/LysM domain